MIEHDLVVAEHDLSHLSVFGLDRANVIKYFGTGMDAYFQFVLFTGIINAILQVVAIIFTCLYWSSISTTGSTWSSYLWQVIKFNSIVEEGIDNRQLILLLTIVQMVFAFSVFIFYRISKRRQFASRTDTIGSIGGIGNLGGGARSDDVIENDDPISASLKANLPTWGLVTLRWLTVCAFAALFYAYYVCQVALQSWVINWSSDPRSSTNSTLDPTSEVGGVDATSAEVAVDATSTEISQVAISLGGQTLMSLFFVVVDAIWRVSCNLLTSLESHRYLLPHRESDCVKSFVCRVAMFSIFVYVQKPPIRLEGRAEQMINLLLINTILSPIVDVVTVWLYRNYQCQCHCTVCSCEIPSWCCFVRTHSDRSVTSPTSASSSSSSSHLSLSSLTSTSNLKTSRSGLPMTSFPPGPMNASSPPSPPPIGSIVTGAGKIVSVSSVEFNLADEYTQLLFRQYLVNQCVMFVPLAPVAGMIGCLLVWWTGKLKLIRYCRVPQRHGDRFFKIMVGFLTVNMLAPLLAYPNGIIWGRAAP